MYLFPYKYFKLLLVTVSSLSGGSKPLLGDMLVIGGTFFYAMSNVGEVGQYVNCTLTLSLSPCM